MAEVRARARIVGATASLAACVVAGCASEAPAPAGPPAVFDVAAACAEYVAAYETAAKCGRYASPETIARREPLFEESCRRWLGAPGSGVTTAVLHACSASVRRMCTSYSGLGDVETYTPERLCDLDVPGTLPENGPCLYSSQCAGGRCDARDPHTCGRCVTLAKAGELCLPHGCAKGTKCPNCKGIPGCRQEEQRCAPYRVGAEGEPCKAHLYDGTFECAGWLVCNSLTGTCTLPGRPGAACVAGTNGSCLFGPCEADKCPEPGGEGKRCTPGADWACKQGFWCSSATYSCEPFEWVPLGAACGGQRFCGDGVCVDGVCVDSGLRDPRLGEACTSRCDPPTRCTDGICQLPDPNACQ